MFLLGRLKKKERKLINFTISHYYVMQGKWFLNQKQKKKQRVSFIPKIYYFKGEFYCVIFSVQLNSVTHLCSTLCDPTDCSTPGFPVHHPLPELTQTPVHWFSDAIQPSHPLSSPSPPTFNLYQHQGLFQWIGSSHQVAKVLEFQLQHQSFQWTPRTDLL